MTTRDYYEILGVDHTATDAELKTAFRKAAMANHPDRNPGDVEAEKRFKEANEAHAVLIDPQKRAAYDRFGHAASEVNSSARNIQPREMARVGEIIGVVNNYCHDQRIVNAVSKELENFLELYPNLTSLYIQRLTGHALTRMDIFDILYDQQPKAVAEKVVHVYLQSANKYRLTPGEWGGLEGTILSLLGNAPNLAERIKKDLREDVIARMPELSAKLDEIMRPSVAPVSGAKQPRNE